MPPVDVPKIRFNDLLLPDFAVRFGRDWELVDGVYRVELVDGDRLSWSKD